MTDKKSLSPIEDAGEFIPYARKHMMPETEDNSSHTGETKPDKIQKISLLDLWQEPDWIQLKTLGTDASAVASMFMIYSNIRKSPRDTHWGVSKE
jgi:hypothetical protein